jgi:hypothetical protein
MSKVNQTPFSESAAVLKTDKLYLPSANKA